MKKLLLVLSLLFLGGGVYGQNCMPADITLSTQTDINNFQTTYGPCSVVTGSLTIDDNFSGDITDLTPLSNITSVGAGLIIDDNPALTSLSGLDGLTSVGDILSITDNNALTTCNQLFHLLDNDDVGGDISISNNLTNGDCENLQDILNAGPPPIPTMSQWSFFLLVLIVFTVGLVGVYNVKNTTLAKRRR